MSKINAFFLIGTLGMLFTSMTHIFMAAITSEEAASSTLWMLYPVFTGFLLVGTFMMVKRKQPQKE